MSVTKVMSRMERHIDIRQGGISANDWLIGQSTLNKNSAVKAVECGAVWLTRGTTTRLRNLKQKLKYGDQLHIYYDEAILALSPLEPVLINDQQTYSIWFKPEGMRGEGTRYGDHCSLARWVEKYYQDERPIDFIYRLDRSISGLMLIVHDPSAVENLTQQFQQGQLRIEYRAWVGGLPHFNHQLLDQPVRGKPARTLVTSLKNDLNVDQTLVSVRLETGRKHQIRQHLSTAGHPIVGDRIYGDSRNDCLQLQVAELHFVCPDKNQWMHFQVTDDLRIDLKPYAEMGIETKVSALRKIS